MSAADLQALAEDIKQNGLAHPIVSTSDGVVLDGRNRLKACEIAGIEPQFEVYAGSNPVGFIISSNLKRRQLNESQRALIATRLATLARGQRQTAFESAERFGPPNNQMRKFADSDPVMTQAAAAAALNVSETQRAVRPGRSRSRHPGANEGRRRRADSRSAPQQEQRSRRNQDRHCSRREANQQSTSDQSDQRSTMSRSLRLRAMRTIYASALANFSELSRRP